MRTLNFIIVFLAPFLVLGQDFQFRKKVDSLVSEIDSSTAKLYSFTKTVKNSANKAITWNYQFKYKQNNSEYVVREFSNRDSSVKQEFYALGSFLIFSTESIRYYYGKDSVGWGGGYYFSEGRLKDYETLGHGKSENEKWNPEVEVLSNYKKAKADVLEFLKNKNGG